MKAVLAYRYGLFFAIATAGVAADLATKGWVFRWLGMPGEHGVFWLWQGRAGFQTSLNEGALFGFGQGKVAVFATLSPQWRGGNDRLENGGFAPLAWVGASWQGKMIGARATACRSVCHTNCVSDSAGQRIK